MSEEPTIVKQLKEAEKLGLLQSKVQSVYEELEPVEGTVEDIKETVGFYNEDAERETEFEQQNLENALFIDNIIFESSIAANSIADCNRVINRVNPAFLKMWRYTNKKEAIGKSVDSFFKNPKEATLVFEALDTTGSWDGEFLAKRKDGSTFISKGLATVINNKKGKLIGYYAANLDVTAQKQADEELKKQNETSKEKYKILFETSRDAIMLLAPPTWKFTGGNKATLKMFEVKNETELTSFGPWDVTPEFQPDGTSSKEKAKKMIEKAMNEGSIFFEWTHKTLNGKEFFASVLLTRVEIEKGKPFLQGTVRDITKQKKADEELKNKIDELKQYKKVTVGRELQMIKLKNKINELEGKLKEK